MKEMLKPALDNKTMFRKTGTILREELDLKDMSDIHIAAFQDNWSPGQRRMSDKDHLAVYARLSEKNVLNQVAATNNL